MELTSAVSWPLLVIVSFIGWGAALAEILRRSVRVSLFGVAERLALGVAATSAIGGLVLALGLAGSLYLQVTVIGGVASAAVFFAHWVVRQMQSRRWFALIGSGLVATTTAGGLLLLAIRRAAFFGWNPCDDEPAYFYLARRIVVRGDLLDAMSNRRLTSLGGMSFLQAHFLSRGSDAFLALADPAIGLLLILTALWFTRSGRWSIAGIAAAAILALFPTMLGAMNTSPVFLPVGLTLVSARWLIRARDPAAPRTETITLIAIATLVGAAVTAMRPQLGAPLLAAIFIVTMWRPERSTVTARVGALAGGAVCGLLGWSIASWRAVQTPLFPVIPGNLDPSWPANGDHHSAVKMSGALDRLRDTLFPTWTSKCWGAAILVALVVVMIASFRHEQQRAERLVTCAFAAGAVGWLAALIVIWWDIVVLPPAYPRFWAPAFAAAAIMPVLMFNQRARTHSIWARMSAGLLILSLANIAGFTTKAATTEIRAIRDDTTSGAVTNSINSDRFAGERATYAQVSARIPANSKVLAAADLPHLLLSTDTTLHTLDIAGSTSPSPHFPLLRGSTAKTRWLEKNGYDYVVASLPTQSRCLYNRAAWQQNLGRGTVEESWTRYVLDWLQYVDDMSARPGTFVVGSLAVIKVT